MHPFFQVLEQTLKGAKLAADAPSGAILFQVTGLAPESWHVVLQPSGCRLEDGGHGAADLTVFCDREQLDTMLGTGVAIRPLRVVGRRELLDTLASAASAPTSSLDLRASLAREPS